MKNNLKKGMAEVEEKQKKALTLSIEDLSALPDDDLFLAVIARTENNRACSSIFLTDLQSLYAVPLKQIC